MALTRSRAADRAEVIRMPGRRQSARGYEFVFTLLAALAVNAKEVGRATTRAVVASSVSVLVLDYPLIRIFSVIWPFGE